VTYLAQKETLTWRKLHGFKNLLAWQRGDDLAALVHGTTAKFGAGNYRLVDQMRGAATSVTRNIAEGYCRASLNEYIRFCEIARGSLGELGSDIHHCERVGLLKGEELEKIVALYSETSYLLDRLINSLREKRRKEGGARTLREETVSYVIGDFLQEESPQTPPPPQPP
jgi:four helix bundle protein